MSTQEILKYTLGASSPLQISQISMPADATILSLHERDEHPVIVVWVLADPSKPIVQRTFVAYREGEAVPSGTGRFLATVRRWERSAATGRPIFTGEMAHLFELNGVSAEGDTGLRESKAPLEAKEVDRLAVQQALARHLRWALDEIGKSPPVHWKPRDAYFEAREFLSDYDLNLNPNRYKPVLK